MGMTNKFRDRERIHQGEHLNASGGAREHAPTRAADVELHIEELVLTGFAESDRHRIGDAVEHELARLLRQNGLQGNSAAVDLVNAGRFKVARGARAQEIGRQIAQTVYGNIAPARDKRSGKR
jgi:hypothetical protein